MLTDRFINLSLLYLYKKATNEVKKFNSKKSLEKISVEREGILLSKNRILDGMSFAEMGNLQLSDLPALGVQAHVPLIDRHSPLAYAIGQHIHWNVADHRGIESCHRFSLQNCSIIQGMSLFKEISDDCVWCLRKKKRLIDASMGPISDHQLTIAPPFWCAQVDIFGPLSCYVPGFERSTRNVAQSQVKTWILASVCVVTKLVNCQVLEKSDASGIVDALTRLSCEVGVPSFLLCDQGSNIMKALREVDVTMQNLQLQLYNEKGIQFDVCSVGGHNEHGLVERVIRSLQDSMEEAGLKKIKLTATGLQTLCKLVENNLNNLPLGFKFGRDQDNTQTLKLLTPNMIKLGRINTRSLSCPLRLPHGASELAEKVRKAYESWFHIWNQAYIPKILFKPKWFRDEVDLKVDDIVYFPKSSDAQKDNVWITGRISKLNRSRDGLIRKVVIKYRNSNEDRDRETERSVRTISKLWNCEDGNLQDDFAELASRLKNVQTGQAMLDQVRMNYCTKPFGESRPSVPSHLGDGCCCESHCQLAHNYGKPLRAYQALTSRMHVVSYEFVLPSLTVSDVSGKPTYVEDRSSDTLTELLLRVDA